MFVLARRDEDRITKKLLSSLNAFLLINGLNIGDEVVKLHTSIRPFLVRTWLTTRDRDLKVCCFCYVHKSFIKYALNSQFHGCCRL